MTSYVYDADGTQLLRRDPTSTTLYLPGEEITRDNATGTLTGTRYYTHNGTVVALRVGGANISYLQADLHGTTQVSVKAESIDNHQVTRRTLDPYGNPLGTGVGVWPDQHGFLNKPHNPATGLTDLGARTYDPTTGLFQSVDPLLDTANPGSWPAYGYANNNPATFADPSGAFCDGCQYGGSGDDRGVGYSLDGECGCRNEAEVKDAWNVLTGRNTDPKKQPVLPGRRVPTFDELKHQPGFAHYMQSGTYAEAVKDWANGICAHQSSAIDHEFCAVADSYGMLGDKSSSRQAVGALAGLIVGALVGVACEGATLGIGTIGCGALAGAAGGATSSVVAGENPIKGTLEGALLGVILGSIRVPSRVGGVESSAGMPVRPEVILTPGGVKLPGVPRGAFGVPVETGKGLQYMIPAGTAELDPRVMYIRVMNPVTTGKYTYSNGYVAYMNAEKQTVNPLTGQTVSSSDPFSHIGLP